MLFGWHYFVVFAVFFLHLLTVQLQQQQQHYIASWLRKTFILWLCTRWFLQCSLVYTLSQWTTKTLYIPGIVWIVCIEKRVVYSWHGMAWRSKHFVILWMRCPQKHIIVIMPATTFKIDNEILLFEILYLFEKFSSSFPSSILKLQNEKQANSVAHTHSHKRYSGEFRDFIHDTQCAIATSSCCLLRIANSSQCKESNFERKYSVVAQKWSAQHQRPLTTRNTHRKRNWLKETSRENELEQKGRQTIWTKSKETDSDNNNNANNK